MAIFYSKYTSIFLLLSMTCTLTQAVGGQKLRKKLRRLQTVDKPIPGQYIVVLDETVVGKSNCTSKIESFFNEEENEEIMDLYTGAFVGAAVKGVGPECLKKMLEDKSVKYVEEDGEVTTYDLQSPVPAWGIDRIDQRILPLDNQYNYSHHGTNVDVYVFDTGIYLEHNEFGGRATCAQDHYPSVPGVLNCNDAHGHGTHVAGTIGGSAYGVAKGVNLKAVKVLSDQGEGSNSAIIAGINYVIQQKTASPTTPMVINMSLGGSHSQALNEAVNKAVKEHSIVVVAAAGNENADACGESPASAELALTVGSADKSDLKSSFSNWGTCLHIWAPGSDILSASKECATCSSTKSGTSMAAPHVAGVAALVLDQNPGMTAIDVRSRITIDDASAFNLPPYKFLLKGESL